MTPGVSRDPRRLQAFVLADDLVLQAYRATRAFPAAERFGLRGQIRRGAVSVPTNLVEGYSRRSDRDYLHFVGIAIGSASEVRYLLDLAVRLGLMRATDGESLRVGYNRVIRALQALAISLRPPEARSPRSEAP
jgi:four helix bundle protein